MTYRAMAWADKQICRRAFTQDVLSRICNHYNDEQGAAWITLQTLAIATRTCGQPIMELLRAGLHPNADRNEDRQAWRDAIAELRESGVKVKTDTVAKAVSELVEAGLIIRCDTVWQGSQKRGPTIFAIPQLNDGKLPTQIRWGDRALDVLPPKIQSPKEQGTKNQSPEIQGTNDIQSPKSSNSVPQSEPLSPLKSGGKQYITESNRESRARAAVKNPEHARSRCRQRMPEDKFNAMTYRLEQCLDAACQEHPQLDRHDLLAELWDAADRGQTFEKRVTAFLNARSASRQPTIFKPYLASNDSELNEQWIRITEKLATLIDSVKLRHLFEHVGLVVAESKASHLQLVLTAPNHFIVERIEARFSTHLMIAARTVYPERPIRIKFRINN